MRNNTNEQYKTILINISKGIFSSVLFFLCCTLLCAAILTMVSDPTSMLQLISVVLIYITFVIGGIFSSHNSTNPVRTCIIYIIIHLLLVILLSLVIPHSDNILSLSQKLIAYIGGPITSTITVFFINKTNKRKKYNRKRRYV